MRKIRSMFSQTIHVFGDSHAEVFKKINEKSSLSLTFFDVCWIGGATAQGLRNPKSKTDAISIYKKKIRSIKNKKRKMFFLLGEVDTGFVIWYRSQKYGEQVDSQLQNSLDAFIDFIEWVRKEGFNNLYVLSVPLPTIIDGQDFGEVANARAEVKASQLERTQLTLRYNKKLQESASKIGYKFISTDGYLLNPSTGLIYDKYMNKDKTNHHLDEDEYIKAIHQELLKQKVL